MEILKWVLYFFIYAFLGWICEVIYCSIPKKKFINRGFLYGPICPIYGYGAILVLLPLYNLKDYWYLVLILGFLITTLLEYITSLVMEKVFHLRWWDYSSHKFNIHGRVCLLNSTLFALLVMVLVYIVHPVIVNLINLISPTYLIITATIFLITNIIDSVYSFIAVGKLNQLIEKFKDIKDDVEENFNGEWHKYIYSRLIKGFPRIQSIKYKEPFEKIKINILKGKEKIKNGLENVIKK